MTRTKPSFLASFSRAQIASAVATAVDFGLLFSLVEIAHVWYVPATALGAFAGAVANFLMNRYWSFEAAHLHWGPQAVRYAIASGISLALNTGGTYFLTEYGHVHYGISVIAVSLVVGVAFNFPMHRHFVYRY